LWGKREAKTGRGFRHTESWKPEAVLQKFGTITQAENLPADLPISIVAVSKVRQRIAVALGAAAQVKLQIAVALGASS
jgi:hypothetical protein